MTEASPSNRSAADTGSSPVAPPAAVARRLVGALGAVAAGAIVAAQVRVNGELGERVGDGVLAATISFVVGLVLVGAIALVVPATRRGLARIRSEVRGRRLPWWYLCSGVAGALYVASQGLVGGIIGAALFTVGAIAGQTVSALLVDRAGIGSSGVMRMTPPRLIAAALGLVAGGVAMSGNARIADDAWLIVLPVLAGFGGAWQQAVNSRLAAIAREPMSATLINFALGTALLAVISTIVIAARGISPQLPAEPWLYVGGLLGVGFVAAAAVFVAYTGVLLFGLASIAGQLATSVVLDVVFPTDVPIALGVIAGVVIAFAAVALASFGRART